MFAHGAFAVTFDKRHSGTAKLFWQVAIVLLVNSANFIITIIIVAIITIVQNLKSSVLFASPSIVGRSARLASLAPFSALSKKPA